MNPRPLTMSANYLAVVRGLRELHRLAVAGRRIRPRQTRYATPPTYHGKLTEVEKRRIGGLSEDLYAITDPQQVAPREWNPQVQSRLVNVDEARRAASGTGPSRSSGIGRRQSSPRSSAICVVSRGSVPATPRRRRSSSNTPRSGNRRTAPTLAMLLEAMNRFNPAEARRAREILEAPDRYEPVVVAFATDVVLDSVPSLPQAEASQLFRRLIPILESTLNKIEEGDEGGVDRSTFSRTCRLLGSCLELLEQYQAALMCYSRDRGRSVERRAARDQGYPSLRGESSRGQGF